MPRIHNNTKEVFILEALRLFSEKGYNAVRISDISDAVGCTAPALYKHFKNKNDLLNSILELNNSQQIDQAGDFCFDLNNNPQNRKEYVNMSVENQIKVIQKSFLHILYDEKSCLFRRFMTIEQFNNPKFALLLNQRYFDSQFDSMEAIMKTFIDEGIYIKGNPRTMAVQFYSPIIMYIYICDRQPERKSEALRFIADHIKEFDTLHKVKKV